MTGFLGQARTSLRFGLVAVTVLCMAAALAPAPASAASAAANIDQCTNGTVGPPIVAEPCLNGTLSGTSFANWVNGNSQGSKSHWREGDFIAYRVELTGLTVGSHTLIFDYQTVHGSKHAIDYVGSFDATETTSPTASTFNRNDSNPCFDILGTASGQCTAPGTAPTPVSTLAVPSATLVNCAGSAGGPITQQPGSFKAFGPTGTTLTSASYVTQNSVAGTGQCDTSMSITVTEPSAGATIVIAWGGHIASQLDWGFGNSASAINGSPFHMSLVSLDGASTGSQDRALATSAVFFTPGVSTTVFDATTNAAWSGTEVAGASAYDTSKLTGDFNPAFSGSVTYYFFKPGTTCNNTTVTPAALLETDNVTTAGQLPKSSTQSNLAAGSYAFQATYNGDSLGDLGWPQNPSALSACEPFTVGKSTAALVTTPSATSITLGTTAPTLKDSATLSGGVNPTGTITFKLTAPNGTTVLDTETVSVSGDGTYTTPAGFTLPSSGAVTGTYQWHASYSGDANNGAITQESDPGAEQVVVKPASPALTTTPGPTVVLGSGVKLTDTAHLTGGYFPTGTITFTLLDPTNKLVDTETVAVTGNGDYTTPGGYLPLIAGTYQWNATYGGDSNNSSVSDNSAANEQEVVSPNTPTLATTPNLTSVTLGTSSVTLKDTAVLSGGTNPTGNITFKLTAPGNVVVDTETVSVTGDGSYTTPTGFTLPANATVVGTYQWDASYSGDANNNPVAQESNPSAEQVVVRPASPTLVTTPAPSSVTLSTATVNLKDSAVLAGGYNPTGTITFTLVGPANTTLDTETVSVSGNGTYTTPAGFTLPASGAVTGTYQWNATYSGDGNNNKATDNGDLAEQVTVSPASPTLSTTPGGTVTLGSGAKLTDTAHLAGGYNPTGTITFVLLDPNHKVVDTETATVSGNGDYTTPNGYLPLIAGTYQWHASYSGDANNTAIGQESNAANEQEVVNPNTPTLTTTPTPGSVTLGNSSVTLKDTATLAGGTNPTGTITFTLVGPDGKTVLDTEVVTAAGDGSYTTPAGYTLATNIGVVGTYQWNAAYSGDSNNNPVTDNGNLDEQVVVSPAAPALVTTPAPSSVTLGTSTVTLKDSALLSGGYSPTGTITFTLYLGATLVDTETVSVSGNGTYTTPTGYTLPAGGTVTGTYQWNASYSGDANNLTAAENGNAAEQVVVSPASPAIVTTPDPTAVSLGTTSPTLKDSAALSGGYNPTGTITFTLIGPANTVVDTETVPVSGNGTYTTPTGYTLPSAGAVTGTYQWNAVYSGDGNNNAASEIGNLSEQVAVSPATPSLATTPAPTSVVLGTSTVTLKDSAALSGGYFPTGTITFTLVLGSTTVDTETVSVSGNGTYTTPTGYTLPTSGAVTGLYQWNAVYSGDANNAGATDNGNINEQVNVSPASPAMTTTPGPTVTLGDGSKLADTAHLTGGFFPTGTITFVLVDPHGVVVDTEIVGVSGNGDYTTPSGYLPLIAGTYQWNASYSGDANNNAIAQESNPGNEQEVVNPSSPTIVTTPTPTAVTLGPAAVTLKDSASLAGGTNPTGTITFTLLNPSNVVVDTELVTVAGNGIYTTPVGYTLPMTGAVTGTYQWNAAYSGDANNNGASENGSVAEQVNVSPAIPNITTTPSSSSVTLGTTSVTITDTATLSGGYAPTGTITFTLVFGATTVDTETVPVSGTGTYTTPVGYTLPTAGAVTGLYQWNAVYSGDSNNISVADNGSLDEQVTVKPAAPALSTTPNPTSVVLSTSTVTLTDTATLSGGYAPTGTITFTLVFGATTVDTETVPVSGNGTYTTPVGYTLPASGTVTGLYQWNAAYSGDSNNTTVSDDGNANEQVTVSPAVPAIATTPNPGSEILSTTSVTLNDTATLSGGYAPTGSITFTLVYNGITVDTETVPVSGDGTYSTPTGHTLPISGTVVGTYQWNATYSGDGNNTSVSELSNASEQSPIGGAGPTIVTSPNPTSATLGTGTVTLKDTATLSGGYFPTGTITFTLVLGSTTVDTETVTVSGNGSYTTPTGYTLPASGVVTGTYQWNASYSGDGNNASATDSGALNEQVTISPASPAIATTPNPATATLGTTAIKLNDSAILSGGYNPTGTITFTLIGPDGHTVVDTETVAVSGNGTYSTPTGYTTPASGTVAGTYQWNASYSGDGNNAGASETGNAAEQVKVSPASPALSTTPNPSTALVGATLKDTATLSGGYFPTGTITFTLYDPTNAVVDTEVVTVSGNGSYSTPTGATAAMAGTYQWVATYSGDANNAGAVSTKGSEPVTVIQPKVSQITPTNTTCQQFAGSTSSTLDTAFYATKGQTISSDNPGVMFYWVKVTVVTSGNHTYTITQGTTYAPTIGSPYFTVASGSFAYDSNCNTLNTTLSGPANNLSVTFNGAPGVYYIGIKYSLKSVVGTSPASTTPGFSYLYTFQTTNVGGSTNTIKLTHQ